MLGECYEETAAVEFKLLVASDWRIERGIAYVPHNYRKSLVF